MAEKDAFKSVKVAKFESDSLKANDYWGCSFAKSRNHADAYMVRGEFVTTTYLCL